MFFGTLTIDINGFSMVFGSPNHWFQWFSMVRDHWSNDGMVSMDRSGLVCLFVCCLCFEVDAAQPSRPIGHFLSAVAAADTFAQLLHSFCNTSGVLHSH